MTLISLIVWMTLSKSPAAILYSFLGGSQFSVVRSRPHFSLLSLAQKLKDYRLFYIVLDVVNNANFRTSLSLACKLSFEKKSIMLWYL